MSLFPDMFNKECSIGVISFCLDLCYMGTILCQTSREHFISVTFHFIFNRLLYYVSQRKYFWPEASLIVLDPDLALPEEDVVEAKAEVGHQG